MSEERTIAGFTNRLQSMCPQKRGELPLYIETIVGCHLFRDLKSREASHVFRKENVSISRITTS